MVKLEYKNRGTIGIEECDSMNVPVECFLIEIEKDMDFASEHVGWFLWTAVNFRPRGPFISGRYEVLAKDKKTLLQLVKKYVVPLYAAALNNLIKKRANYYWE